MKPVFKIIKLKNRAKYKPFILQIGPVPDADHFWEVLAKRTDKVNVIALHNTRWQFSYSSQIDPSV